MPIRNPDLSGFCFFAKTPPERRLCSFRRDLRAPRPRSPPLHIAAFRFARARSHAIQAAHLAPLRPQTTTLSAGYRDPATALTTSTTLYFIRHYLPPAARHIVFYLYIVIVLYSAYKAALPHPVKSRSPIKFKKPSPLCSPLTGNQNSHEHRPRSARFPGASFIRRQNPRKHRSIRTAKKEITPVLRNAGPESKLPCPAHDKAA